MSANPIHDSWQLIERAYGGFCCDSCCSIFRAMYFAGAMDVMEKAAGFNPELPTVLVVDAAAMARVANELAVVYSVGDLDANPDRVRH